MKEHLGKFGILYILLALAGGIFAGTQWSTWFPKTNGAGNQEPVLDANGNPTGRFVSRASGATSKARSCCSYGGGFVGNCNYPITAGSNVPSCATT